MDLRAASGSAKNLKRNQTSMINLIFAQKRRQTYEGSRCCNIFDIGRQEVAVEYKYNLSPINPICQISQFLSTNWNANVKSNIQTTQFLCACRQVMKTFKNSTAERVPSECSQLRYTCDILEYLFKSTAERVPSECSQVRYTCDIFLWLHRAFCCHASRVEVLIVEY